jgi:hypothetical protein
VLRVRAPLPLHWSPFAWLSLCHEATQGGHRLRDMAGGDSPARPMHICFQEADTDDSEWSLIQVCRRFSSVCHCVSLCVNSWCDNVHP